MKLFVNGSREVIDVTSGDGVEFETVFATDIKDADHFFDEDIEKMVGVTELHVRYFATDNGIIYKVLS